MKLTIQQLYDKKPAIRLISTLRIGEVAGYDLSNFFDAAIKELTPIDKVWNDLVKKHSNGEKEKGVPRVPPANLDAFYAEWEPFASREIELPDIAIPRAAFAPMNLSVGEYSLLKFIIKQP